MFAEMKVAEMCSPNSTDTIPFNVMNTLQNIKLKVQKFKA